MNPDAGRLELFIILAVMLVLVVFGFVAVGVFGSPAILMTPI